MKTNVRSACRLLAGIIIVVTCAPGLDALVANGSAPSAKEIPLANGSFESIISLKAPPLIFRDNIFANCTVALGESVAGLWGDVIKQNNIFGTPDNQMPSPVRR